MNNMYIRNLTSNQIAKKLNKSANWVRTLARNGEIPATKKGGYWYFNEGEVKTNFNKENNFYTEGFVLSNN